MGDDFPDDPDDDDDDELFGFGDEFDDDDYEDEIEQDWDGEPIPKPAELLALDSVTEELFATLRRW